MTELSRRQVLAAAVAGSASLALGLGRTEFAHAARQHPIPPRDRVGRSDTGRRDPVDEGDADRRGEAGLGSRSGGRRRMGSGGRPGIRDRAEVGHVPDRTRARPHGEGRRRRPAPEHRSLVPVPHWTARPLPSVAPGRFPHRARRSKSFRIGVVTCAEWEFGFFGAYRHLAARDDVAVVIHLGDYIYEFGRSYGPRPTPGSDFGRVHEPGHEIVSLADYRIRYAQYHTDAGLQALHAAHPMIVMWDDHEIANDTWKAGAQNHDASEGPFPLRAHRARQAFREWIPIREDPVDPEKAYRSVRFGDLAELWMLDERRYRDAPPTSGLFSLVSIDPAIEAEGRSMIGVEQRAWLAEGLKTSTAQWRLIGNPVPMLPQNIGPEIPNALRAALLPLTANLPINRPAYYIDDWNGYVAERTILYNCSTPSTTSW